MKNAAVNYGITRSVIGAETIPISLEEFKDITCAHGVIEDSFRIERAFDLLAENYFEFEQELLRASLDEMIFQGKTWRSYVEKHQTLCRRIMNVLSTGTQYFDQLRVGSNEIIDGKVQRRKHELRQESLDYRIGREIRNSITHWHFDAFDMSSFRHADGKDEDRQIRFGTAPKLWVKALASDPSKHRDRALIAKLEKVGDQIDLMKVIRGYIESLGNLHQFTRDCVQANLESAEKAFHRALNRREQLGAKQGVVAVATDESGELVESCFASAELLDYFHALRRKNSAHVNLTKRYVSNMLERDSEPTKISPGKDAWDE